MLPPKFVPTESEEQCIVADYLNYLGVFWFHPANEGKRSWMRGKTLKAEGLIAGVPDVIIMQRIPKHPDKRGAMIEMKRRKGGKLSAQQADFLSTAKEHGWVTFVAHGADEAIQFLKTIGF